MCSRYIFKPKSNPEIERINQLALKAGYLPKEGDTHPNDEVAVVTIVNSKVKVVTVKWGFIGFNGKLLINARSETVQEKVSFAGSFKNQRCVFPMSGFYEWSKEKDPYFFDLEDGSSVLYACGSLAYFDGELRSVMYTRVASPLEAKIHDRMPLLISKSQIMKWLADEQYAINVLQQEQPKLAIKKVNSTLF